MKRKICYGVAAVAIATASMGAMQGAVQPAQAAGTCPNNNHSNITDVRVNNNFTANGVNIRTGDSIDCTSKGQGQKTHDTRLHCYHWNGYHYWDHLRDITTSIGGWVREDHLAVVSGNAC